MPENEPIKDQCRKAAKSALYAAKHGFKKKRQFRYPEEPEFDELGRRIRIRHPPELRDRLAEAQNWRCCHCGERLDEPFIQERFASLEHVVRFRDGGADDETNLVVAHKKCNEDYG